MFILITIILYLHSYIIIIIPLTSFSYRGSDGVGKDPLICLRLPAWLPPEKNPVKMQSLLMSPSETPRKINILTELLHSVREWLRFIHFGLPNGSQLPPSPGASQNGSQMPCRCLSASSAQLAHLRHLSPASSDQPA